jgi:radical SAM superfamily enzyme YgiQ (UPF0313 family)
MTDLVLIHPGGSRATYGSLAQELSAIEPPLWCRLIAGYCRDRGVSVKILDAEAHNLAPGNIGAVIATWKPQIAAIVAYGHQPSASTQSMPEAAAIARAIKHECLTTKVVVLGGHVSALPLRTLKEERAFDYAIVGEGPVTLMALLRGERGSIPGLITYDHRTTNAHMVPSAKLIEMRDLRGNAWDLLPMQKYRAHNWQCFDNLAARQPYASIHTSLGCPYKCSFCCINAPFESNRYRMREPIDVVSEIGMLFAAYGVRTFKITDEMFVLNERHYTAIAKGIIALGIGEHLNIWAYARVDTVKPGTLALLRAAGICWLALGIESGSAHVRDGAEKRLNSADIAETVGAIEAAGINVIANYIFGLPDDDHESMKETLRLAITLNTAFANFYSAMAYPGSALYDQADLHNQPLPKTWAGYSQHSEDCRPMDTHHVTGRAVLRFRDEAFQAYFTRPNYLNMIEKRFGAEAATHIRAMTAHRLRRKLLETAEAA